MRHTAVIIERGTTGHNGEVIAPDCLITAATPTFENYITWNFNQNCPLGNVIGVDCGNGEDKSVVVEVEINEDGSHYIRKINELIKTGSIGFECGGEVVNRDGDKITQFDIQEVSLVNKKK